MSELKIEAGKFYKCRDGRKAFVAGRSPFPSHWPFVGVIEGASLETYGWQDNGVYDCSGDDEEDLIAEWREPVAVTATILLVRNARGEAVVVAGNGLSHPRVIARRTLTITEGEGLPGATP